MKQAKGPRGAADRIWSQLVRHRANGACERCRQPGRLEAAHVISRKYSCLRTDLRNGMALCPACHRAQHDGLWHAGEVIGWRLYEELRTYTRDNTPFHAPKHYWVEERDRLKKLAKEKGVL